jgi:hypothetical protein
MPTSKKKPIIVIGGGIAGIGTALKLANDGYQVTIIEKNTLMSGSSGRNPGRMGLGFHYFDEDTAVLYLKASILVQKTYPHFLIGQDLPFEHPIRHGRYYIVKDSQHSYEEILKIYRAIQIAYADMVELDPTNKVFGEPESFFRVLSAEDYIGVVNSEIVVGAVETNEHLYNWPKFLIAMRQVIENHPYISLFEYAEVINIQQRESLDARFKLTLREATGTIERHLDADYIVNSSWENIEFLNSTAGIPYLDGTRTNRLKCLLEVKLPPELQEMNSSFFCMGPFCMFSNMGDGRGMMTFADVTNFAVSTSLRIDENIEYYLSPHVSHAEKEKIGAEILSGVSQYIPAMAKAIFLDVKFGIVQTKGKLNLSDLKSNAAFAKLKSELAVQDYKIGHIAKQYLLALNAINFKKILILIGLEGILSEDNLKSILILALSRGCLSPKQLDDCGIIKHLNTPSAFDDLLGKLGLTKFSQVLQGHHKRNYFGVRQEQQGLISNPAMKLFYFILNSEYVYSLLMQQFANEANLSAFYSRLFSLLPAEKNIELKRSIMKYVDSNLPYRDSKTKEDYLNTLQVQIDHKSKFNTLIENMVPHVIKIWSSFKKKANLLNEALYETEYHDLLKTSFGHFLRFRESMVIASPEDDELTQIFHNSCVKPQFISGNSETPTNRALRRSKSMNLGTRYDSQPFMFITEPVLTKADFTLQSTAHIRLSALGFYSSTSPILEPGAKRFRSQSVNIGSRDKADFPKHIHSIGFVGI